MADLIVRELQKVVESRLLDQKAIIILGARQTGKTTLLKSIFENKQEVIWLNADNHETRLLFTDITVSRLKTIIGRNQYVVIDEAQRIKDIGIKLKLITDQFDSVKLIATGSSSFELANEINEPLTGRKWEFNMFPLSFKEMSDHHGFYQELQHLEQRMIYGYYPDVVNSPGDEEIILNGLVNDYLYKDILIWNKIKKADKLLKLLQALAFQIGNEVSYTELGNLVQLDNETVTNYIDLLEKAYVIFRLSSFRRNLRTELGKSKKIYFFDNGIRNSLMASFNPFPVRNDVGPLWENFLISERVKYTQYHQIWSNKYFWRTTRQQEIDYLEERSGRLHAYEFKWNPKAKTKFPRSFQNSYPESELSMIHKENFEIFLGVA